MSGPVLIVDDSPLILQMLEMVCQQAGYETVTASEFSQARDYVSRETPAAVIADLNMPGVDDTVAELKALTEAPIIIVSGRPQDELNEEAASRGADGAISKDAGMPGISAELPGLLEKLM